MRQPSIPISILLLMSGPIQLEAQFDQPLVAAASTDSALKSFRENENVSRAQFLNQGSVAVTNGSPKVNLQALTYYIAVSDTKMFPFYLATNLATVADTTLESAAESLLNEFGGLVNASAGYYGKLKLGHLFNFADEQAGLFLDIRGGVRGDDLGGGGASLDNLRGFSYTLGMVKLVLPVFRKAGDNKTRAGNVTIGASVEGLLSLGGKVAPRGFADPFSGLGYVNGTASLNLTDALVVRAGRTFTTTQSALPKRWFVAGSLVPAPKATE